jgi:hypothetical protein
MRYVFLAYPRQSTGLFRVIAARLKAFADQWPRESFFAQDLVLRIVNTIAVSSR